MRDYSGTLMTYESYLFMDQIKYDKKYAEDQILNGEWYDLVQGVFWNEPYHFTYLPHKVNKYTEFIEFLDGNGFKIEPIAYDGDYVKVELIPE